MTACSQDNLGEPIPVCIKPSWIWCSKRRLRNSMTCKAPDFQSNHDQQQHMNNTQCFKAGYHYSCRPIQQRQNTEAKQSQSESRLISSETDNVNKMQDKVSSRLSPRNKSWPFFRDNPGGTVVSSNNRHHVQRQRKDRGPCLYSRRGFQ